MKFISYQSPFGELSIAASGGSIVLCDWNHSRKYTLHIRDIESSQNETTDSDNEDESVIRLASRQLDEYFAGLRKEFDLPLAPVGTPFQQRVWDALSHILYGKTISYSEIAEYIGNKNATRAVANAIGCNSLSIIIPCHRVIGSNGAITGYAGGIEAKRKLLDLEKRYQKQE